MISVIIPVYNAEDEIVIIINRLLEQLDISNGDEIIVIDNGSEDKTSEIVQAFDEVTLLIETNNLNSPYSCRNRGIEEASGDILVFLDASCIPIEGWIEKFKKCVKAGNPDLLGGDIYFSVDDSSTLGELTDAISNVNVEISIQAGHVMTANLLVKREVIETIGRFPEGIRSGGDVRWTGKAVQEGFDLQFCKEAIVYKKPRKFKGLLKKSWRVGKWQPLVWCDHGNLVQSIVKAGLKFIIPPNFFRLQQKVKAHSYDFRQSKWIGIFLIGWLSQWVQSTAVFYGLILMIVKK